MDTTPNRLIEIFSQAQAKASPAERERYLTEACLGQPELRKQVEALLGAGERAGDFLGKTVKLHPSDRVIEGPGTVVGHYKLLQQIGEGGCGVVYMAEQEEPIRRRVAFKVIKLGMDTKQVIARFEAERQALALMDHPNIAKVLDAGATDTGRPYFVMELVRGIRITDYCDQNNLSTEQRLDLFIQVCHAIQHAHQKGIIHRDIKPSNILVTFNDGVPVPKVIDFGIAKATEQRLTDKTLFTAFEQFIGTPAYMSPEQAEMASLNIDTRSDIYALGVLLYELLTGQTPFNAKELIAAGVEGMRRIIREKEPTRPSTCISTLGGAEQTTVAKRRQSDPPKLVHQVRGDLDWIVMKCLEKDRTRRYETANGLAADIERHLEHRPVLAAAPSALYRARKFVHRHKTAMMVATALLGLLVAGVVVSTWQAVRATRAEHEQSRERQRAEQNEEQAQQARAREAELRQQAQAQEWLARQRAYASDMKAIQAALEQENRGLVDVLLRRYLPKPGEEDLRGIEWRYLWHLSRGDEVRSFRHSGMVQAAVLSPDGQYLATANSEGRIALWEVVSGRRLREFLTSPFGLTGKSLSFSPDGGWLALPGPQRVEIRNTARWDVIKELAGAGAPLGFAPDGRYFVANSTNGLRVWDLKDWGCRLLTNALARYNNLAFAPDGTRLFCGGGWPIQIESWDLVSGARTPIGEKDAIISLTVSPDGKRLAAGTWQGEVSLWDWATGQRIHQFLPHPGLTYGLAFSANGKYLVTGGSDQVIRFWETGTTNPVATLHGHSSQIWSLNLSRDGQSLVSASKDGTARIWSTNPPEAKHRACALPTNAIPLGSLPDGSAFVTVDDLSKAIQLWSLPGLLLVRSLAREEFDREGCRNVQAFPTSETVVGATPSGTLHLWDLRTGAHLRQVTNHETNVAPQALAPDKRWLFAHLPGGGKALFDLRGGQHVRLFPEGRYNAAFSRDGHWLAYDTQKNSIKVWDLEACREQATLEGHRWRVLSLEFSPDGRILASLVFHGRQFA